jgi:aspartate 1-decarboxylase
MNGPAARRCSPGDIVIVVAYGILPLEEAKTFTPTLVFPDTATNKLKQVQKTK